MPDHPDQFAPRIAVIGGGISGLAAANRVLELAPHAELALFESADRLGGVLHTAHHDDFLVEHSADQFITDAPAALDLCHRLGLADELLSPDESRRRAYVVHEGRLHPVPPGFVLMVPRDLKSIAATPILSLAGKIRVACEAFIPPRKDVADESIAAFARRRLGREAFDRLVAPLVGGIYAGDAEKLSIQATLSRFPDMETKHGSLIRAARHTADDNSQSAVAVESAARYGLFVAPRGGMTRLVDALAARIGPHRIHLGTPIDSLSHADSGWSLVTTDRSGKQRAENFDAVIVTVPAHRAARLLDDVDDALAATLQKIPYGGCVIHVACYRRDQFTDPLDGFGFVVPPIENRRILACSYSSNKFPGRAPSPDHVVLRTFLGGAHAPHLLNADDESLNQIVVEELAQLLGLTGPPTEHCVARYDHHMPQYHLGHLDRIQEIEARADAYPGLELAGAAYHGVGIPHCVQSGEQAAHRAITSMENAATG